MPALPALGTKPWKDALETWLLTAHNADGTEKAGNDATKVDKDSVVVAATRIVASKLLVGDTQPAFQINGNGEIRWGVGGTTAYDTVLRRLNVGQLSTPNSFVVGDNLYTDNNGVGGKLYFGSAVDTNLYRSGAATLQTDGAFIAGTSLYSLVSASGGAALAAQGLHAAGYALLSRQTGDTQYRFSIGANGTLWWGPGGSTAVDVNLYRYTTNILKTDYSFRSYGNISAGDGNTGTVALSAVNSAIYFGLASDCYLGRAGAKALATDSLLSFRIGTSGTDWAMAASKATGDTSDRWAMMIDGAMQWGSGTAIRDTFLYRQGVNTLKTDGNFAIGTGSFQSYGQAATSGILAAAATGDAQLRFQLLNTGYMSWGAGGSTVMDTTLYRYNAGFLKTDGALIAATALYVDTIGSGFAIYFGSASDLSISRWSSTFLAINKGLAVNAGTANQIYLADNGVINFGSASDTALYRTAPGYLETSGNFKVGGQLQGGGRLGEYAQSTADWNTAQANGWYMGAGMPNQPVADGLWYIGEVIAHNSIYQTQRAWNFTANAGSPVWERRSLGGTWTAWSANNLYRVDPTTQRLNDTLFVGGQLFANYAQTNQIVLSNDASSSIWLGQALDTRIYRVAAGWLGVQGTMQVSAGIQADWNGTNMVFQTAGGEIQLRGATTNKITLGATQDTNLYRYFTDVLATDDNFISRPGGTSAVELGGIGVGYGLRIGGDTSLYRVSANLLGVTDAFNVDRGNSGKSLYFGSSGDVQMYRQSANLFRIQSNVKLGSDYTSAGSTQAPILPIIAGATDPDFQNAVPGMLVSDPANNKLWLRCNTGWRSIGMI